jgi:Ser/Thr protein kinase RdoA (MazF antagonist)
MHLEMDTFRTSHDRYHLDERILVERPLASLAPYAGSSRAAADLAELGKLGERLTGEIQRLRAVAGAYGIVHADLHRGNTVLTGYQQVRPLSPSELAGFAVLAACRAMWDIGDWLGAADRTGDAWVTEAVFAKLLADVRKAESDLPPRPAAEATFEHADSSPRDPHASDEQPHHESDDA